MCKHLELLIKKHTIKIEKQFHVVSSTITNVKVLTKMFAIAMHFHFAPPHSSLNWQRDIKMQEPSIKLCISFACSKT
jgi:hypothetical protein